jgi:hypothetical protein
MKWLSGPARFALGAVAALVLVGAIVSGPINFSTGLSVANDGAVTVDQTVIAPLASPHFTGTASVVGFNEAQASDIASASTTDIGAAAGTYVRVTGTTTISGLGTVQAGTRRVIQFSGSLTLTHNATSLILPDGYNIQTAAGDVFVFVSEGSGNWRCVSTPPMGRRLLTSTTAASASTVVFTLPAGYNTDDIDILDLVAATNGASVNMVISEDGGSTFKGASYDYANTQNIVGTGVTATNGSAASALGIGAFGVSNGGTATFSASIRLLKPGSVGTNKDFFWTAIGKSNGGNLNHVSGGGTYTGDTNAYNAVRFSMSAGNITGAVMNLYGIRSP